MRKNLITRKDDYVLVTGEFGNIAVQLSPSSHYVLFRSAFESKDSEADSVRQTFYFNKIKAAEIAKESGYSIFIMAPMMMKLNDIGVLLRLIRGSYVVNPFYIGVKSERDMLLLREEMEKEFPDEVPENAEKSKRHFRLYRSALDCFRHMSGTCAALMMSIALEAAKTNFEENLNYFEAMYKTTRAMNIGQDVFRRHIKHMREAGIIDVCYLGKGQRRKQKTIVMNPFIASGNNDEKTYMDRASW